MARVLGSWRHFCDVDSQPSTRCFVSDYRKHGCYTRRTIRCIDILFSPRKNGQLKLIWCYRKIMGSLSYSIAQLRGWYHVFKEGRQLSISKEDGSATPVIALTEENINTAAVIVREDHKITLRCLSERINISLSSTQMLLPENYTWYLWAEFSEIHVQKEMNVEVCSKLESRLQNDAMFF